MNFKRLLHTELGKTFISVILGLGLAALFRKVCKDKNCIVFNGPILSDFEDKVYEHDGRCYNYSVKSAKCDVNKKVIDITDEESKEEPSLNSLFK